MPIYIDNNVSWRMFMSQWQIEALLTIAETFQLNRFGWSLSGQQNHYCKNLQWFIHVFDLGAHWIQIWQQGYFATPSSSSPSSSWPNPRIRHSPSSPFSLPKSPRQAHYPQTECGRHKGQCEASPKESSIFTLYQLSISSSKPSSSSPSSSPSSTLSTG